MAQDLKNETLPHVLSQHPRGHLVSKLGLGTVKFGRNTGVKYPGGGGFALPDDKTVEEILDLALELGITLLDTAPAYGVSEERLGKLLGRRRDKFFLITKTGEEYDGETSRYDFNRDFTIASIERSLHRLKTDYLDAVLVHSSRDDLHVVTQTDVLPTLRRLQEQGKIGLIGVSSHTVAGGLAALEHSDAVMVAHNRSYQDEAEVIAAAHAAGKAVFVKKALASGHSADPAADLEFVVSTTGVTAAIIGSMTPANIRANAAAVRDAAFPVK